MVSTHVNRDLASGDIFHILPEEEHEELQVKDKEIFDAIVADGLHPGTTKINFKVDGWDGSLMIVPVNSEHKVFRRRGPYGGHSGGDMHELISASLFDATSSAERRISSVADTSTRLTCRLL